MKYFYIFVSKMFDYMLSKFFVFFKTVSLYRYLINFISYIIHILASACDLRRRHAWFSYYKAEDDFRFEYRQNLPSKWETRTLYDKIMQLKIKICKTMWAYNNTGHVKSCSIVIGFPNTLLAITYAVHTEVL